MLKLVSSVPDFFAHQGRWPVREGLGFGCNCAKCGREVSAPFGYEGKLIWCLYCGMYAGHVPLVELPFGSKTGFGLTRDECIEIAASLECGGYHEASERRARREGRVFDLFGGLDAE
ncbi:MAG: hypothetical protein ACK4HD_07395 [Pannonibacter phragmitetus]